MTDDKILYITEPAQLRAAVATIATCSVIALDSETRGLDPYQPHTLRSIQIALPDGTAYVINTAYVDPRPLKPVLESPNILKLLQNAKFDYKVLLQQTGIRVTNIFDTMLAERLLTIGVSMRRDNDLKALGLKYAQMSLDKDVRKEFVGSVANDLTEEERQYAARDTTVLFPIWRAQQEKLATEKLVAVATLEFDTLRAVGDLELAGVLIDLEAWGKLTVENVQKAADLRAKLDGIALPFATQTTLFGDSGFNFNSTSQLIDLYGRIGHEVDDTKSESLERVVDELTIKEMEEGLSPDEERVRTFTSLLLEYRVPEKAVGAFGEKFMRLVNPYTGRIHADFNQLGADTGRFCSSNPNLQQIPKETAYRSCFVAADGYKIITADYGNCELRILAQLSGDKPFIDAFNNGVDLHRASAAGLFKVPIDAVTGEQRQAGKILNFSVAYGAGPSKIAASMRIPMAEAQGLLKRYFDSHPGLRDWLEVAAAEAVTKGYSVSALGRKRYYAPITETPGSTAYKKARGGIERQGKNMPIQSTNADMTKLALVGITNALRGYDARIVNCVHDEIGVEARADIVEEVAEIVRHEMVEAGKRVIDKVEVVSDVHIADCWSKD